MSRTRCFSSFASGKRPSTARDQRVFPPRAPQKLPQSQAPVPLPQDLQQKSRAIPVPAKQHITSNGTVCNTEFSLAVCPALLTRRGIARLRCLHRSVVLSSWCSSLACFHPASPPWSHTCGKTHLDYSGSPAERAPQPLHRAPLRAVR